MSLFHDDVTVAKNSFTKQDAAIVLRQAADKLDSATIPAEVTDIVIEVAKVLLQVGILATAGGA